ncbi:hypothetical protein D3C71_2048200 [compost metagenome]
MPHHVEQDHSITPVAERVPGVEVTGQFKRRLIQGMHLKSFICQRQAEHSILHKGSQLQLILYALIPFLMPILLTL